MSATDTAEPDGSFLPPGLMQSPGAIMMPERGKRAHLGDCARGGWLIIRRRISERVEVENIARPRRAAEANRAFHEARLAAPSGWLIEIYKPVLSGWWLISQAPRLLRNNITDGETALEVVHGHEGEVLGYLGFEVPTGLRSGGWWLEGPAPASGRAPEFRRFQTRLEAITAATADSSAPGDAWATEWSQPAQRMLEAGIGTSVELSFEILGPTGVHCTMPGCENEAYTLVVRTGADVGRDARLACFFHGGEAIARQTMAPPPSDP